MVVPHRLVPGGQPPPEARQPSGRAGLFSAPDAAPAADGLLDSDPELAVAWRRLSARQREVLALVVLDELPVAQAAVALGVSANAASIRLHRAKKALAEQLAAVRDGADGTTRATDHADPTAGERSRARRDINRV